MSGHGATPAHRDDGIVARVLTSSTGRYKNEGLEVVDLHVT